MSGPNAKITSIETLESFHQMLGTFSEDALAVLDSVNTEVQKRLRYLEFEVAGHWRREHQKWKDKYKEASKELSCARTPSGRLSAEQIRRTAKTKIRECETKLAAINEWLKRIPHELPLPQSRLLKLKTFIVNDVDKGRALLKEYCSTLREYTDIKGSIDQ